jgi:hypothetical protein
MMARARLIRLALTEAEVAGLLATLAVGWDGAEEVGGDGFEARDLDTAEAKLVRAQAAHETRQVS